MCSTPCTPTPDRSRGRKSPWQRRMNQSSRIVAAVAYRPDHHRLDHLAVHRHLTAQRRLDPVPALRHPVAVGDRDGRHPGVAHRDRPDSDLGLPVDREVPGPGLAAGSGPGLCVGLLRDPGRAPLGRRLGRGLWGRHLLAVRAAGRDRGGVWLRGADSPSQRSTSEYRSTTASNTSRAAMISINTPTITASTRTGGSGRA
jgi:hypothetical protein